MRYHRWLITVRVIEGGTDSTFSIICRSKKRIIDFDDWLKDLINRNEVAAAVILNVEKLPMKWISE